MRLIFKPVFFAMLLFIAIFTISCGTDNLPNPSGKSAGKEEPKPTPIPPPEESGGSDIPTPPNGDNESDSGEVIDPCGKPGVSTDGTNTLVTAEDLIGGYEIVYFYSFADNSMMDITIDTGNLASVQNFTGEAAIDIVDSKLHLTTKIRLDSQELASLISLAGDQRHQHTVYTPIDAVANNGVVGKYNAGTFEGNANYDIRVENDEVIIRQKLKQTVVSIVSVTSDVTIVIKLKKISDNAPTLSTDKYPTFDKPVADENITPFPVAELSRIVPKQWHGQYELTKIAVTSDRIFTSEKRADILDYKGEAAVIVTADECSSVIKVATKYQLESRDLSGDLQYKLDELPEVIGEQTKNGIVGTFSDSIDDNESNFILQKIDDNLSITKRVNKVTYEYTFTKIDDNATPLQDYKYWKMTPFNKGEAGEKILGYYRITDIYGPLGATYSSNWYNGSNKFYGNMLIYTKQEDIDAGKRILYFKYKWQDDPSAPGMYTGRNGFVWSWTQHEVAYDCNTISACKSAGNDWYGKIIYQIWAGSYDDSKISIEDYWLGNYFDKYLPFGSNDWKINMVKLYDLDAGKTIDDQKYY